MSEVAARLAELRARIAAAAHRAGRDPADLTLVAVSKYYPVEAVREAAAAGVTDVGESYAQELARKRDAAGDLPLRWHFIGRLQRNKVKEVVGRAALVHAVDSQRLADEIERRAVAAELVQPVLVAVNLGGEEQKSGVAPGELPALLEHIATLPHLRCQGLMTMPPWPESPEDSRPFFAALRQLRDQHLGAAADLSMGTSGDLEVAVEEGATFLRVGSALFGPRPT